MKTFKEIQDCFDNMSNQDLIDYHTELLSNDRDCYDIVNETLLYCYGEIDYNLINKLHWHFATACVNKLKQI